MEKHDLFKFHLEHNGDVMTADQIPKEHLRFVNLPGGVVAPIDDRCCYNIEPAYDGHSARVVMCVSVLGSSLQDI